MPAYLGIDPGASGGLALINGAHCMAHGMPATERDLWERLKAWDAVTMCCIEKVGGYMPGSKGNIGSAMFKFGQSYGFLRGCLTAAGIPYEEVHPAKWQRSLGIAPRGREEPKNHFKNRLKQKAQQLFPKLQVTLCTADALLIAEHCRRVHG